MVHIAQKLVNFARRRLLEQSSNLAAAPASDGSSPSGPIIALPTMRSSGAFPAVPNEKKKKSPPPAPQPSPAHPNSSNSNRHPVHSPGSPGNTDNQKPSNSGTSGNTWKYIIISAGVAVLLILAAAIFCMFRSQAVATIGPWKTGLSGQLQKAFITGDFATQNRTTKIKKKENCSFTESSTNKPSKKRIKNTAI